MIFSVVIQKCIQLDIGPITFSGSMISLNLLTHNGKLKSLAYTMRNCRASFDFILLVVIPVYIMTIDSGLEEGGLDLVMNFTALYILCDIDQLMALRGKEFEEYVEELKSITRQELIVIRFSGDVFE